MKFQLIIDEEQEETVVVTAHRRSPLTDRLEALILEECGTDRLQGHNGDEWKNLTFDQIECITVLGGKTYAVDTQNKQYRLRQRLYELEEVLPAWFIRINKSALANEKRLDRFAVTYSGGVDAVFKSGFREYVSRRCFAEIKRRYEGK